jgi:hypothetical protein
MKNNFFTVHSLLVSKLLRKTLTLMLYYRQIYDQFEINYQE